MIFQDKIIVIEEDLILSPDFLYTLALLSETFRKDDTIGAIQMWNPNGNEYDNYLHILFVRSFFFLAYEIVNGSLDLFYRVDNLYGLGYLLKRSFYDQNMKTSFKDCCAKRLNRFSSLKKKSYRVFSLIL